jgi:hypothetical protein
LRALAQSDFLRRLTIIIGFSILLPIANPSDPQYLTMALPLILHPDERLIKASPLSPSPHLFYQLTGTLP